MSKYVEKSKEREVVWLRGSSCPNIKDTLQGLSTGEAKDTMTCPLGSEVVASRNENIPEVPYPTTLN